MTIPRPIVGEPEKYRGRLISAHYMGPDLLAWVDGEELPNFYETTEAARAAARRYIDRQIEEAEKK